MIKELSQFYWRILELSSENKGLKQAQDRSVEMTVSKPPSWIKHVLKNSPGYQVPTFNSKRSMPADLFRMQSDSFILEEVEVIENR